VSASPAFSSAGWGAAGFAPVTTVAEVGNPAVGEGTVDGVLAPIGLSAAAMSAVAAAVDASVADNTRTAYTSDWARFESWCHSEGHGSLPADPLVVAAYLVAAVAVLKPDGSFAYAPATLTRWCSSINNRHTAAGFEAPGRSEVVRRTLAGIRKTRSTPPRRVRPLRLVDVHTIVTALREKADTPRASFTAKVFERRNSAVLLLLLFGALRSDELTHLQIGDVTQEPQSLHLAIRRSKTDQQAVGQVRGLPWRSNHRICPLCGHVRWREVIDAADTDGHPGVLRLLRRSPPFTGHVCEPDLPTATDQHRPLIRALTPAGRVTERVLTGTGMYRMIRTTATAAGFPDHIVAQLGAHSPGRGWSPAPWKPEPTPWKSSGTPATAQSPPWTPTTATPPSSAAQSPASTSLPHHDSTSAAPTAPAPQTVRALPGRWPDPRRRDRPRCPCRAMTQWGSRRWIRSRGRIR